MRSSIWAAHFRNSVVKLNHQDYDAVLDWPSLPYVQRNHPTLNILHHYSLQWEQVIVLVSCIVVFQWDH
jgi:hypothetical protein